MITSNRRVFLGGLGASVAAFAATGGRRALALGGASVEALDFGEFEPLAGLMQETEPAQLQAILLEKLGAGATLDTLIAAASLANARFFGGHDYEGYHCMMALGPALAMSRELPKKVKPLPVLKVIYRTAARIQKMGGGEGALLALPSPKAMSRDEAAKAFRGAVLARDVEAAETAFAALLNVDRSAAYDVLQTFVQENLDVHKVVLAWRACEAMQETGEEHGLTLLRQSIRFCIDREEMRVERGKPEPLLRTLLPELIERHGLGRGLGETRSVTDDDIEALARTVFSSSEKDAAQAMAAALADGFSLQDAGEALSLASNWLLIRDPGRKQEDGPTKPKGSVHGASVGVHASDSARAWRNIAASTGPRTAVASLIAGACHAAGRSHLVDASAIPYLEHVDEFEDESQSELLSELRDAIKDRDQVHACSIASAYTSKDFETRKLFSVLLAYGVRADGALHAEKYYRTVREEFAEARPKWKSDYVISLARVTASEYGWPAPGMSEAREALGV